LSYELTELHKSKNTLRILAKSERIIKAANEVSDFAKDFPQRQQRNAKALRESANRILYPEKNRKN
jgi:hypothetical protein